jgi:porin
MDQLLLKEHPDDDADSQGLGVFLRYGYAHADVNAIEHFWSLGGQYQGLLPGRDEDVLALGFAQGLISRKLRAVDDWGGRESVYEAYYSMRLTPCVTISPDLQYISDTGGDRSGRDAVVVGLRVVMSF